MYVGSRIGRIVGNSTGIRQKRGCLLDGSPSLLVLTVLSETSIKLDWTNGSTNESGICVYRSLDGVTYSLIHITDASVETYTDTGLTSGTEYYYKVRAKNGEYYSEFSNIESETTS